MFDYVDVQYPVPMPKDPKGYTGTHSFGYQTKDLENCLTSYQIRKDGSVWWKQVKSKYVAGNENSDSIFGRLGRMEPISSKWVRVENIPKSINVYDYNESEKGDFDYFIEYEISFAKGRVKKVKLVKFEANDNSGRKARTAEWQKKWEQRDKFCSKWYFKYILSHWNKFICKSERMIHKMLTFATSNLYNTSRRLKF